MRGCICLLIRIYTDIDTLDIRDRRAPHRHAVGGSLRQCRALVSGVTGGRSPSASAYPNLGTDLSAEPRHANAKT